jgi:signal transduction histidine kinase
LIRVLVYVFGAFFFSAAVVYSLETYLADTHAKQVMTGQLRERFRPLYILIEEQTLEGTAPDIQSRFERLTRRFNYPAKLLRLDEAIKRYEIPTAAEQLLREDRILVFETDDSVVFLKRLGQSPWAVTLFPPSVQQPFYLKMRFYYGLQATLMLAAIVLLGVWFLRDIKRMKTVTQQVANGQLSVRMNINSKSLLHPVATDFNEMANRLELLMASNQELVSAVSHEIRRPLARMHFYLQMAIDARDDHDRHLQLDRLTTAIHELDALTDEILTYTRLNHVDSVKQIDQLESFELIQAVLEDTYFECKRYGKRMVVELGQQPPESLRALLQSINCGFSSGGDESIIATLKLSVAIKAAVVVASDRLMARAVKNLFSNAMRYAKAHVHIEINRRDNEYVIHVDDDGAGIHEADCKRVFEPFVRVDSSRSRDTGGYGLGLAIVARIATWHGGTAAATRSPLGGARITLRWPVASPST